jgi:hypothetical protein
VAADEPESFAWEFDWELVCGFDCVLDCESDDEGLGDWDGLCAQPETLISNRTKKQPRIKVILTLPCLPLRPLRILDDLRATCSSGKWLQFD